MNLKFATAPAHIVRTCAGVLFLAGLAGACERAAQPRAHGPRTIELEGHTVRLADDASLFDVLVRSTQQGDFEPAEVHAKPGDFVRFRSGDNRTHGIVLSAPTPEAEAVLAAAGQLRSPPLVARGQAFVVSLENLPSGRYTITCISHAGQASLIVQ